LSITENSDAMPSDDKKIGTAETPDQDTEEAQVKHWLAALKRTEDWRDQTTTFSDAKRFTDEYKGKWDWIAQGITIPLIPINLVFAYVKTEIARLYFRDPWITVNAKRVEEIGAANIAEQIINYTWSELDLKRQIKLALLDALLVGHGWIKVGYTAEFGTIESRPSEAPPSEPIKRGPGRPKKKPEGEAAVVETNTFIKSENVFAVHLPYKQVVFDPSAVWPVAHTARWMAIRYDKPLRAVKESGIYDEEAVEQIKPWEPEAKQGEGGEKFRDVRMCRIWEIYDLDHMKLLTVSPGVKKYLREDDYPEELNKGFPLVEFSFNPLPGEPYAMSDIAPHEPQIVELTKMMAIMLNHLKRWNRQIFVKPELMTDENKTNFKNATDGAIIEIQGNPQTDFFIPPYAPVQQDIYGIWNLAMDMWKNVAGQSAMERGAEGKAATRTLGELRMQLQGGKARSDEKVDVLEDSIAEVARKLLAIMQKKYDLPKIARIVGERNIKKALEKRPTAQPQNAMAPQSFTSTEGFSWNKEDIHGEMDVDVIAGSTAPMDRDSQLEQIEKMIPIFPAMGITPGSPAAKALGREWFRLVGIPSLESIMDLLDQQPPQPPPKMMEIQAKMKAKEAETQMKMKAKQQEMQMKGQENQMKMQGLAAKTQADIVKAKLDVQKSHQDMQNSVLDHLLKSVRGPEKGGPNGM
jgi:hypothetical protein